MQRSCIIILRWVFVLTLTKCVDGVVPLSQVNDVTVFGLRGDVEHQGGTGLLSLSSALSALELRGNPR